MSTLPLAAALQTLLARLSASAWHVVLVNVAAFASLAFLVFVSFSLHPCCRGVLFTGCLHGPLLTSRCGMSACLHAPVRACARREPVELLKPKRTFNPVIQRFYKCVDRRALDPSAPVQDLDPEIQRYLNPDATILKQAEKALAKFKNSFRLVKVGER